MRKRTERPIREKVRDAVETLLEDEYALLDRALQDLNSARGLVSDKLLPACPHTQTVSAVRSRRSDGVVGLLSSSSW